MPESSSEHAHRDGRRPLVPIAEMLCQVGRLSYEMQHDDRSDAGPTATAPTLERLTEYLASFQDFIERPPAEYEQLASVLRRIGLLVRDCSRMEWWDARDHYPEFNSLYQTGMELLAAVHRASATRDPLAFLDEAIQQPSDAAAEEPTSAAQTNIEVDLEHNRIVIDGTEFVTTGETARMAQLLLDHQGEWVAMSKHGFTKPSEVKRRLPAPLLERVEAEKGKGYRLR